MSNNNEMCRGCIFYKNKDNATCKLYPVKDNKVCPCVSCIVKSMCIVTCEDFDNFDLYYYGKLHEKKEYL